MKCPKCQKENYVKAGKVKDKQRYKCKECGCEYTRDTRQGYDSEMKKKAIHMYIEGNGFRTIGRLLSISNVTVYKWITNAAKIMQEIAKENKVKKARILELDEMWAFVQKKRERSGSGWLLIETKDKLSTSMLVAED